MSHPSRSFKSALDFPQRLFADYQRKINQQRNCLALIKSVLPAELAEHALHCVINEKMVLLYTDAAIWSSQLRFYHQAILAKLNEEGYRQSNTLQIKLMQSQTAKAGRPHARIPSQQNIELLRQQGLRQTDAKLNRALVKLSETLNRLSSKQD